MNEEREDEVIGRGESRRVPGVAVSAAAFSVTAFVASCVVAVKVGGTPFGTVSSAAILAHGAVDGSSLCATTLWLCLSAQFVHQKFPHMVFNVVMFYVLGSVVEKRIGTVRFTLVWVVSGSLGILASVLCLPGLASSGASQALLGVAASSILLIRRGLERPGWYGAMVAVTLAVQTALDLIYAHTLKPGHVTGFVVGLMVSLPMFAESRR